MFKTSFITGLCLALGLTLLTADAEAAGRAGRRVARQQSRIGQGLQSGQLTAREAGRLERGERRLNRNIRAAKSDGNFTASEKARINREQNRESGRIFRQKHDAQTRGGTAPAAQ